MLTVTVTDNQGDPEYGVNVNLVRNNQTQCTLLLTYDEAKALRDSLGLNDKMFCCAACWAKRDFVLVGS